MEVKKDIDILQNEWWSGGQETVDRCVSAGKGQELVSLIEEHFSGDMPTEEVVNDLLRFDDDWIFSCLGISDEEEDDDDDEDRENDEEDANGSDGDD